MESFVKDSPEVAQEKERIFNELKSKSQEEILCIWKGIVALDNSEYEEAPEYYKPGITWLWWVESVRNVLDNLVENQTLPIPNLYRVSANMDQLQREGMEKSFTWIPHPRVPNRVHTELEIDQARALYNTLKSKGMVAFRTWIDD